MTPLLARYRTQLQFLTALLYAGLLSWTGAYLSRPTAPAATRLPNTYVTMISPRLDRVLTADARIVRLRDGATLRTVSPDARPRHWSVNGRFLVLEHADTTVEIVPTDTQQPPVSGLFTIPFADRFAVSKHQ